MINHEQPAKPETAIDLSEEERLALYGVGAHLLKSRGVVIKPDPNTKYINEEGKEHRPDPYLELNIPSEELAAVGLAYDGVTLQSQESEFDNDAPTLMYLEASRVATRTIDQTDSQPMTVMGNERQWVVLSRDQHLGIVVEDEGGEGDFYSGPDAVDTTTVETGPDSEQTIELRGPQLYMLEGKPLSRADLCNVTAGLEKIT
ncbi:MAG TPA: hypothetical protein VH234_00855 [Candidatus Saccharimonadales bacterium]|jgi:hypothetical protein|nr:hypothetical protein [Candidatus Saccharimonadales bacterium]